MRDDIAKALLRGPLPFRPNIRYGESNILNLSELIDKWLRLERHYKKHGLPPGAWIENRRWK